MLFPKTNATIPGGAYTATCLVKGCPEASFPQICLDLRAFTYDSEQSWSEVNIATDKFYHSGSNKSTKLVYIHTNPSVILETGMTETPHFKIQRLRQYVEGELNLRYSCAMSVNEVIKSHAERFALLFTHDTHVEKNMLSALFGQFLSPWEHDEEKRGTTRSYINMYNENKSFVNFNTYHQVKAVMAACERKELFLGHTSISLHDLTLVQNSEKMELLETFLKEEEYLSVRNELPVSVIEGFVNSQFVNKKTNETQRLNMVVMLRVYLSEGLRYQFDSKKDVYCTGCSDPILTAKTRDSTSIRYNGNRENTNFDCVRDVLVPDQCNGNSLSQKPLSGSPVKMYVHVPWYGKECPKMHIQLSELEQSTFQRI